MEIWCSSDRSLKWKFSSVSVVTVRGRSGSWLAPSRESKSDFCVRARTVIVVCVYQLDACPVCLQDYKDPRLGRRVRIPDSRLWSICRPCCWKRYDIAASATWDVWPHQQKSAQHHYFCYCGTAGEQLPQHFLEAVCVTWPQETYFPPPWSPWSPYGPAGWLLVLPKQRIGCWSILSTFSHFLAFFGANLSVCHVPSSSLMHFALARFRTTVVRPGTK